MRNYFCAFALASLTAHVAGKADPVQYATPTPDIMAAHKQVPLQQAVANLSADSAPEESVKAVVQAAEEPQNEEDIQSILQRNPLVQLARHISHGMLDPDRDPPYLCRNAYSVEIMSRDPLVIYIRDFLQPGEAEHMISSAVPAMARSMVASLPTNDTKTMANKMDEQRTSSSAFMTRGQDAVMQCIEQRAADFVGEEREKLEGLQVVWYRIGQKYNPFVYLNDATFSAETGERIELEGGATSFPKLGISVQPRKGDAVFWSNLQIDGEEEERVLHGGDPVIAGQKMGMNIWMREVRSRRLPFPWLVPSHKNAQREFSG